jgi:hypothetical protein
VELQKRGSIMVASLRAHADRLRADAVAAAAAERTKGRRLADGARSLIAALEASGRAVDPELRTVAKSAAGVDETHLLQLQSVMNQALARLQDTGTTAEASAAQRGLAERLGAGEQGKTLGEWLAAAPSPDSQNLRLDALLAEIGTFADTAAGGQFSERAEAIAGEADQNRRALLTDSLILDAARYAQECRAAEAALQRLQEARAALAPLTSEQAAVLAVRLDKALQSNNAAQADALCAEATALAEREMKEIAVQARRQAVLSGLAGLGYEVRESMVTAWAQNGRLVVRKPSSPDYGLELGAPADAARLQVRLVGAANPSSPRNAGRDRDQEVTWCSEFDQLRASLAATGDGLVIERALEAGAQPVKSVPFEGLSDERAEVERILRSRTFS